jgi:hypothetical protein
MPIEIRELVIRAHIDPGESRAVRATSPCGSEPGPGPGPGPAPAQDDLIQSCVREVLRILEDKRER